MNVEILKKIDPKQIAEGAIKVADKLKDTFDVKDLQTVFLVINLFILTVTVIVIVTTIIQMIRGIKGGIREFVGQLAYRGHGDKAKPDIRKFFKVSAWFMSFGLVYLKIIAPAIIANRIEEWLVIAVFGLATAGSFAYTYDKKVRNED